MKAVKSAVAEYQVPYLNTDLFTAQAIRDLSISNHTVHLHIELGFPWRDAKTVITQALTERLKPLIGKDTLEIKIDHAIEIHAVQHNIRPLPEVKNIIAVASGKGGVGKSTTAVNLALALRVEGAKVGILDADIYGPNQPQMLGGNEKPTSKDGKHLDPVMRYEMQTMSIGYLIDENTAMIWRGPIVTTVLQQLVHDTAWSDLDYLIVDLPPGTGDVVLTLTQKVPVSAAVLVTTPQDVALLDVTKGLKMFEKVNVPILGVIENMSVHICSKCGNKEHIFGERGGQLFAERHQTEFLGSLPLNINIRSQADQGKPIVIADPESDIARMYRDIACRVAAELSLTKKDFSRKFPNIVVQND